MYPTLYYSTCNFCHQPGTLYHMVWECQKTPSLTPNPHPTYEQWADQLASSDLSVQRILVERARAASADQGFPDYRRPPTWRAPEARLNKVYPLHSVAMMRAWSHSILWPIFSACSASAFVTVWPLVTSFLCCLRRRQKFPLSPMYTDSQSAHGIL